MPTPPTGNALVSWVNAGLFIQQDLCLEEDIIQENSQLLYVLFSQQVPNERWKEHGMIEVGVTARHWQAL